MRKENLRIKEYIKGYGITRLEDKIDSILHSYAYCLYDLESSEPSDAMFEIEDAFDMRLVNEKFPHCVVFDYGVNDDKSIEPRHMMFIPQSDIDEKGMTEDEMQNLLVDELVKTVNKTDYITIKENADVKAFIKEHAKFLDVPVQLYCLNSVNPYRIYKIDKS